MVPGSTFSALRRLLDCGGGDGELEADAEGVETWEPDSSSAVEDGEGRDFRGRLAGVGLVSLVTVLRLGGRVSALGDEGVSFGKGGISGASISGVG
jgi:hypothetical protein